MNNENTPWQYKPDAGAPADTPQSPSLGNNSAPPPPQSQKAEAVSWTSAEYIEHQRSASWYPSLILATAVLSTAIYFITKDYFATGTIIVLGFIVGYAASHKPRQLDYEISDSGIRIGPKTYTFNQFKSFSVIQEGDLNSVNLLPNKRFMPMISVYFPAADQERIVNALGNYLPYEERQMSGIDKLSHRLRF